MQNLEHIQLESSWKQALSGEFEQPYMQELAAFLRAEKAAAKQIYPPGPLIFNALNSTPLPSVKVVILGQDPYHGPGQAHGLSFSVPKGITPPPSLQNIFKELARDLCVPIPSHGCLQQWAEQGVLLLNSSLTVEQGQAASHAQLGWQRFTDQILRVLNAQYRPMVFMLWGKHAQNKASLLEANRHLLLKTVHPSPLSAYRGFIGCGHFGLANAFLLKQGLTPIDWQLH